MGAGEMAPRLRAVVALEEDRSSSVSTTRLRTVHTPAQGDLMPSSGVCGYLYSYAYTNTHTSKLFKIL